MQRRSFIKNTSLVGGLLTMSPKELLAQLLQQPAYKLTPLRNNVGIFTEKGGTIAYCFSKEGITVVDSQFPDQAKHAIDELKKLSPDNPFNLLINTHHHGDHTGGNIAFKDLVKHVVGHENCLANYKRVAEAQKNADKQLFQDVTFKDTWKQKIGGETIKAHYFGAAHTNGDAIIHFEHANIAHMGDLMFNRRHPVVDRTAGASIKNWIQVLDKTNKTFDNKTLFVFGHALDPEKVTGGKEDLSLFKDYFEKLLAFTEQEIKAGKTKEEFIKNTAIPGVTEWKGDGIQRPLTAAYEELTS